MPKEKNIRNTRRGPRRRKGNKTRGKKKQYFKKPVVFGHVYSDQCIH